MVRRPYILLVALVLIALAGPSSHASTVTLEPDRDNTLFQNSTGLLSNGIGIYSFVGRTRQTSSVSRRRTLIRFDVASAVPAGAIIHSARLRMRMDKSVTQSNDISAFRVLADWGEANSIAGGSQGRGGAAQDGDATWVDRFRGTSTWTTPGGDFAPMASAQINVSGVNFYDWQGAGMVADVQFWLDDPPMNFGWILVGNEAVGSNAKRFRTREHGVFKPTLTIEYYVQDGLAGTVNTGIGPATDVLRINGSAGDANRVVRVGVRAPVTLAFDSPPANPSARYGLWVWQGPPCTPTPMMSGGAFIGTAVNAIPPLGGTPQPTRCLQSPGLPASLCQGVAEVASAPARVPFSILCSRGAPATATFTVQGVVQDGGAANTTGFSATNAVVLIVE